MDWLALAMVSPVAMLAAALTLRWAHGRDLTVPGVATAALFGLTASLFLGVLLAADALVDLAVTPLSLQSRLLGSVEAGPRTLVSFREAFLPEANPPTQYQWSFRLHPQAQAGLRRRCRDPGLTGECILAMEDGARWDTRISLVGGEMRIQQSAGVE